MKDLSIIIVNFNTKELLKQCIKSIYKTTKDIDFEIFVVDNSSHDGSTDMIKKKFPHVKLIENKRNVGFAVANNQAIRKSKGRYVLLLNPDTIVLDDALREMVDFIERRPDAGITGCKILNPNGTSQPVLREEVSLLTELVANQLKIKNAYTCRKLDEPRCVNYLIGACMLIRKEAFDKAGLFDERFFMYSEDMDLCKRIRDCGYKIFYYPKAKIIHYGKESSKQLPIGKMGFIYYKSRHLFFKKHYGTTYASLYKYMTLFMVGLKYVFSLFLPLNRELYLEILKKIK